MTGLLGSPVAHSISPLMHNESFRKLGLDYIYLCFDVKKDHLETAVEGLKACGIRGFNVTMPHKNRMVELMDRLSPAASLIGAVNTVINDDGILTGCNTDGMGFMRAADAAGYDVIGQEMTMLGNGGAATAVCAQAALDGVKRINVFMRKESAHYERTETLAKRLNEETASEVAVYEQGDIRSLRSCISHSAILVNGTSVGMTPDVDHSLIEDPSLFRPGLIVSDLIYEPKETKLLRDARVMGCRTLNGMNMLLYQGAESFKLWTAQEMPIDLIREKYFEVRDES